MPLRLYVKLLGPLEVEFDGRRIDRFRTQRSAALLAYLALYPDRTHSRDTVIECLWPDVDPDAGRARLRTELAALRKSLGDEPGDDEVIDAGRGTLRLVPGAWRTDLQVFDEGLRSGRLSSGVDAIPLLERACDLYRGPLLSDFDDAWIDGPRARVAADQRTTLRELCSAYVQNGNAEAAAAAARRAVAIDPLDEAAHCALMRIYLSAGQGAAAVRHFQELERLLSDALDIAPGPEARSLALQAKERAETVAVGSRPLAVPVAPPPGRNGYHPAASPAAPAAPVAPAVEIPPATARAAPFRRGLLAAVPLAAAALALAWIAYNRQQPSSSTQPAALGGPQHQTRIEYDVIDLGTLGGGSAEVYDMNERGEVVGISSLPGTGDEGFVCRQGPDGRYQMERVGRIDGFERSRAWAINRRGEVAVAAETLDGSRTCAAIWLPRPSYGLSAGLHRLALPNTHSSYVKGIDDRGELAGEIRSKASDSPEPVIFRIVAGRTEVRRIPGFADGRASLPDRLGGVVVKGVPQPGSVRASYYCRAGKRQPFQTPQQRGVTILDTSHAGAYVGQLEPGATVGGHKAVVFQQGEMVTLQDLGGPMSCAWSINGRGVIVGMAQHPTLGNRAVRWSDGHIQDLNDLIDPAKGWRLEHAKAISDRGLIAGDGSVDGKQHAFLLNPREK